MITILVRGTIAQVAKALADRGIGAAFVRSIDPAQHFYRCGLQHEKVVCDWYDTQVSPILGFSKD